MNTDTIETADFIVAPYISSSDLAPDTVIQVSWAPNRRCNFRHIGEGSYEVLLSENSRLAVGDTFRCPAFIFGQPLFIDHLNRLGEESTQFVGDNQSGISDVTVLVVGTPKAKVSTLGDIRLYLSQRLMRPTVPLSVDGERKKVVSLEQALRNALSLGLIRMVSGWMAFPPDRPELECGFMVHKLKEFYSFAGWYEIDLILCRIKRDGSTVKSLRQTRTFSPMKTQEESALVRTIFNTRH